MTERTVISKLIITDNGPVNGHADEFNGSLSSVTRHVLCLITPDSVYPCPFLSLFPVSLSLSLAVSLSERVPVFVYLSISVLFLYLFVSVVVVVAVSFSVPVSA